MSCVLEKLLLTHLPTKNGGKLDASFLMMDIFQKNENLVLPRTNLFCKEDSANYLFLK
jgi:hypothetical protein